MFKKKKNYRGTPLMGNPGDVIGFAPQDRKAPPPFSKATFGKYELHTEKKKWGKSVIIFFVILIAAWLVYESINGLKIFEN